MRTRIAAHICDFAQAVALGYVRLVRSARELSSKSQLYTTLRARTKWGIKIEKPKEATLNLYNLLKA